MKLTAMLIAVLLTFGSTVALAGNYEILYDTRLGAGWYGGDDRAVGGPRDVGIGQGVLVDADILLESFSFYFTSWFDYAENPDTLGHAVTLTLNIRDEAGAIQGTAAVDLPDTYNGGWVTWTGLNLDVTAGTTLIFTSYLNGAYTTHQYTTGNASDANAGYPDGTRYVKTGTGDADMEVWAGWSVHSWDAMFWLQGSTQVPVEERSWGAIKALYANQP